MNFHDAQNLLGVPRYASRIELKKRYITLIKIHHPDINTDKKRANKLTSDINEAYEVFLKHRDQEKWKEKGAETKTTSRAFDNNKNANRRSQHEDNYGIWDKQSKQTPLGKNPFWQSNFVSNYSFTPECFCFIGITSRFPTETQVKEAYHKAIDSHHPRRFYDSPESFERCKFISLAFVAVCSIRDAEKWSHNGGVQSYQEFRNVKVEPRNDSEVKNNIRPKENEFRSLGSAFLRMLISKFSEDGLGEALKFLFIFIGVLVCLFAFWVSVISGLGKS